jgi:hypothetical protein
MRVSMRFACRLAKDRRNHRTQVERKALQQSKLSSSQPLYAKTLVCGLRNWDVIRSAFLLTWPLIPRSRTACGDWQLRTLPDSSGREKRQWSTWGRWI